MKFMNPLLAVTDMERSVASYREVLGLRKVVDLGANVTLTGGVSLQTRESWLEFIEASPDMLAWQGRVSELYFEEDDFDAFAARLKAQDISYVHGVKEHPWGQRAVRIYDPDGHILEIGENMQSVCRRFLDSGMTEEEAARRMGVPLRFAKHCARKAEREGKKQ